MKVGDAICSDDARRLKENEVVVLLEHPKPLPRVAHPTGSSSGTSTNTSSWSRSPRA